MNDFKIFVIEGESHKKIEDKDLDKPIKDISNSKEFILAQ
jgi:hypothetical protein